MRKILLALSLLLFASCGSDMDKVNEHRLSFHYGGGTDRVDTVVLRRGSIFGTGNIPDATQAGLPYDFIGWFTTDNSKFNADAPIFKDIDLYGMWEVTVSFDPNGGADILPKKVLYGNPIGSMEPAVNGSNEFLHWKDSSSGKIYTPQTILTDNVDLKAVYAYYLTFYPENGDVEAVVKVAEGDTVDSSLLPKPTNGTRPFMEWNTAADGTGDKFDIGDPISVSESYYAVWYGGTYPIKITNVEGLRAMELDLTLNYALSDDIDLEGADWSPISGTYSGIFDGNNHIITGLYINKSDLDNVGLFSTLSGTVKDLGLVINSVTGRDSVGGIAGTLAATGIIQKSYVTMGKIGGRDNIGGIVGSANGRIADSFATSDITGANNIGGISGTISATGGIANVIATGDVSASVGGAGGVTGSSAGIVSQVVAANSEVTSAGAIVSDRTPGDLYDVVTYTNLGWTFDNSGWKIPTGGGYPILSWKDKHAVAFINGSEIVTAIVNDEGSTVAPADPISANIQESFFGWNSSLDGEVAFTPDLKYYTDQHFYAIWDGDGASTTYPKIVSTMDELQNIALDKHYRLIDNITLTAAWTPIGSIDPFIGTFDGRGHTVSGLSIRSNATTLGLFGILGSASTASKVFDLKIGDADLSGGGSLGILAGYVVNGEIERCEVSGTISGVADISSDVGGVVGKIDSGFIRDTLSAATVSTLSNVARTGGVTGYARGGSVIESCTSTGNVSGIDVVGGLVGLAEGALIKGGSATGTISCSGMSCGGLVGQLLDGAQVVP
ncbi:MAG: InlB B-repeat-containing protein [Deferribacteraceae bacterium]|jgi:hypothetical protein|nr:InlB B-repeat-containing protein [Deferribacteraceae bacterium]